MKSIKSELKTTFGHRIYTFIVIFLVIFTSSAIIGYFVSVIVLGKGKDLASLGESCSVNNQCGKGLVCYNGKCITIKEGANMIINLQKIQNQQIEDDIKKIKQMEKEFEEIEKRASDELSKEIKEQQKEKMSKIPHTLEKQQKMIRAAQEGGEKAGSSVRKFFTNLFSR